MNYPLQYTVIVNPSITATNNNDKTTGEFLILTENVTFSRKFGIKIPKKELDLTEVATG